MTGDGKASADDRTVTSAGRSKPAAPPSPPHSRAPQPGQRFGKYQIVKLLGQGGMGAVYEAIDTVLQRRVALKILPDQLAKDEDALKRFVREARAAAQLNHPNTVILYDVAKRDETTYITMELVVGTTAQALIDQHGKMPVANATRIVADICKGVAAAHKLGLVHRDIKPTNILVNREGVAKLSDFGLAKPVQQSGAGVTQDNTLLGTPNYMSPEQAEGKPVDGRTDIYALGGTYHALLTGKQPYVRATTVLVLYAHCHEPPPDPRSIVPDIPEACARIIQKAMAKSPADRYANADEMLRDLLAVSGGGRDENAFALHEALNQIEAAAPTVVQLPTTTRPARKSPAMSGPAIAGIVVGAVVLVMGLVIGVMLATRAGGDAASTDAAASNLPQQTPDTPTNPAKNTVATVVGPGTLNGASPLAPEAPKLSTPDTPKSVEPPKPVEPVKSPDAAADAFAPSGAAGPATQPANDEATQAILKEWETVRDRAFKVKDSNSVIVIEKAFTAIRQFVEKHRDSANPDVRAAVTEAERMMQRHREAVAEREASQPQRPGGANSGGPQGDRPKPPAPPSGPRGPRQR